MLAEVQQKYLETQSDLQSVGAQISSKTREIKLSEATEAQLKEQTKESDTVWKGVGKMFLGTSASEYIKSVEAERQASKEQLDALKKKQTYLESTFNNLNKAISEIVSRSQY
jgi:prefoldin subunit 1